MDNNIKIKEFLIAGGNSTLLVWNCPLAQRSEVIKQYLGKVEQVGFVRGDQLIMMGNELCINGTIALASQLASEGEVSTSGVEKKVSYTNKKGVTTIGLSLPIQREKDIILLGGIGFLCTNKRVKADEKLLSNLARKYNLPAFGVVIYRGNRIQPFVYVVQTRSLFKETACGSGSIATSMVTGLREIVQPTGEIIRIVRDKNKIFISARVTQVDVD